MKKRFLAESLLEIVTITCFLACLIVNRISAFLWVKGYSSSDYTKLIGCAIGGLGVILAFIVIGRRGRKARIIRSFIVVAIGIGVITKTLMIWSSGEQVGGYMEVVEKNYNSGKFGLVLASDPKLVIRCDKKVYTLAEKNKKYLVEYRVIHNDKTKAYLISFGD